jgi:glucuronosyltransferase
MVAKGHNVTFVSPYPPKEPNPKVTEFSPKEMTKFVLENEEGPQAVNMRIGGDMDATWFILSRWGLEMCKMFVESPDTQEWLKNNHFDLVVIDGLYNDCGMGIAYKYSAPHILFDTSALFMWQEDSLGIPPEHSWVPDMQYHYPQEMSFMQRFWSVYNSIYWGLDRELYYLPQLTEVLRKGLNMPDLPPLREIERNVSLVLMNSHYSEEFPRSLPPLVIPVGGMHIKETHKPLPKNFEDFITTNGNKGFVYISFGSAVQLSQAPPEILAAFLGAVKRIDTNFIWKWEAEVPKDLPKNVFMQKWMPQQDILAHPKIKGFVTHSGLMSIQEAIYHGVPLVSMPVFAEQDYNAERVHAGKYGIRLEITTVTEDQLVDAISKILHDPIYKQRMLEKSKRFKDRPMKPVETAVWWVEFVLRQGDTSFLRPLGIYQNWFVRRSLDVYLFVFSILAVLLAVIKKAVAVITEIIYSKPNISAAKLEKKVN